ncbi:MAG TPA: hypothetical protein VFR39_03860 [Burkholderiales bacterium]|nr:hypothetical protein [Burkholderiales bacterium]
MAIAKAWRVLAITAAVLFVLGCQGKGGDFQRGQFIGYVTDKTEEEVAGKVGKPDSVDNKNPNVVKWVYKNKTFDADNNNQVDPEITLIFQKDSSGKFKVSQVIF